ncbi:MAG: 6-pyruvoyl tetrahydropterin synthase family protein [Candidatus Melainabacteria bacterium]
MFEVKVEKHFSAAHHLLNYEGPCANPHGHNYVVQVVAQTRDEDLDQANIAIDFSVMKRELDVIIQEIDHTDLNEYPPFAGQSPSAELIARYIYQRIKPGLPQTSRVIVYETPTQYVAYYE